jgi:mRNA interferase MazF
MTRRGEIYLVDLPRGREGEQHGLRPALIIQNDVGNEFSPTTIVAAMTSRLTDYDFHVRVTASESGMAQDSTVMLEQIRTLSQRRLGRLVGRVPAHLMDDVDQALHRSLGIIFCPDLT